MSVPEEIQRLVTRFADRRAEYESTDYLEARVRVDFINPFFQALGWDIANIAGRSERERDVITEGRVRSGSGFKAPDYIFQAFGEPAFMVEAKKPSVDLKNDAGPALQLRRYAWSSASVGTGIVTDFQEFAVYDCSVPPDSEDGANSALMDYLPSRTTTSR